MKRAFTIVLLLVFLFGCTNKNIVENSLYNQIDYENINQISENDECVKIFLKENSTMINRDYKYVKKTNHESFTSEIKNKLTSNDYTFRSYMCVENQITYRECIVHKSDYYARYGTFFEENGRPVIDRKNGDGLYKEQILFDDVCYEKDFESNEFKIVEKADSFKTTGILGDLLKGKFIDQYKVMINDKEYFLENVDIDGENHLYIYDKNGDLIACSNNNSEKIINIVCDVIFNENNIIIPPKL